MTKEEYVKELEKQFDGETLIPEGAETASAPSVTEEAPTATQTAPEEASAPTASADTGSEEKPAEGSAEATEGEEPKDGEEGGDGKKFSHRKFKKMEYENRTLRARLEALEAKEREREEKESGKSAKEIAKPRKADYENEEEYTDALIAFRLQELAKGAKETENKQAKESADAQKLLSDFSAKIEKYVPVEKREWLNDEAKDGMEMLTEITGGKKNPTIRAIISSAKAPIVLAECLRNPSLAEALAKMDDVERKMTIWKIGETSRIFADTKTEQTSTDPVQIVGKVGVGATSAPKSISQMTDDELYAEYLKSGGRI